MTVFYCSSHQEVQTGQHNNQPLTYDSFISLHANAKNSAPETLEVQDSEHNTEAKTGW